MQSISERICFLKNIGDRELSFNEWTAGAFFSLQKVFEDQQVSSKVKLSTLLKLRCMLDAFISMSFDNNKSEYIGEIPEQPPVVMPFELKILVDGEWKPVKSKKRIKQRKV